jgi:hypothetical protein
MNFDARFRTFFALGSHNTFTIIKSKLARQTNSDVITIKTV